MGPNSSVAECLLDSQINPQEWIFCNTKCHLQIGKKMRLWAINSQQKWKVARILKEPMASHPCREENLLIRQAEENK